MSGDIQTQGGSQASSSVETNLLESGIAFVMAPTGSMANNGAVTLGTALPLTYSEGCYMLFPAGAIAAGIPAAAAWYWVIMSSTTVGTVYNSTYSSGVPVQGTQTAFATTGPGAFTGVTTETTGININLPANTLGVRGKLTMFEDFLMSNNADGKTINRKLGGTTIQSTAATSGAAISPLSMTSNRGVANVQYTTGNGASGVGLGNNAGLRTQVDTTQAQTVSTTMTRATATDYMVQETAKWTTLTS